MSGCSIIALCVGVLFIIIGISMIGAYYTPEAIEDREIGVLASAYFLMGLGIWIFLDKILYNIWSYKAWYEEDE